MRLWVALMRCPASLRLSIASSSTVSSSGMSEVYGRASSDHPIILSSPASSPTRAERSRAVSLATSFGSCGATYATTGGATSIWRYPLSELSTYTQPCLARSGGSHMSGRCFFIFRLYDCYRMLGTYLFPLDDGSNHVDHTLQFFRITSSHLFESKNILVTKLQQSSTLPLAKFVEDFTEICLSFCKVIQLLLSSLFCLLECLPIILVRLRVISLRLPNLLNHFQLHFSCVFHLLL